MLLLPICSCIHFQTWFYVTWPHLFYTEGVSAWLKITWNVSSQLLFIWSYFHRPNVALFPDIHTYVASYVTGPKKPTLSIGIYYYSYTCELWPSFSLRQNSYRWLDQLFRELILKIYTSSGTDPGGWMGWLATHHELYSFTIFYQKYMQI